MLWQNWCRLCAKQPKTSNDEVHFSIFLDMENAEQLNVMPETLKVILNQMTLTEALLKYFSLMISASDDDNVPKMICLKCLKFVANIIMFHERIIKVQEMFGYLEHEAENLKNISEDNLHTLLEKFQILQDETEKQRTIVKKETDSEHDNENTLLNDHDSILHDTAASGSMEQEDYVLCNSKDNSTENDPFNETLESSLERSAQSCCSSPSNSREFLAIEEFEEKSLKSKNVIRNFVKRKKLKKTLPSPKLMKKDKLIKKHKTNQDIILDIKCRKCGCDSNSYYSYREHMQLAHPNDQQVDKNGSKDNICPLCDKVVQNLYQLERHLLSHVPLEQRKSIQCPECAMRYITKTQLQTHIKLKHNQETEMKAFICEECGLCVKTNSNLRQHMLIHTDLAPFECDVCKKKFKNQARLKIHMDIHSPNKHICAICGLQLNSRATLNRHFLVHSDEMQHKCDYCGRAFKRAKALKNHLILHTGLKPYSCDFCDRTFANGSNCRSHMKKAHPEELAKLEASGGNKAHARNIPKLETLKAVTKAADNLTPVVTKYSGRFAFGKKPKSLKDNSKVESNAVYTNTVKEPEKLQQNIKNEVLSTNNEPMARSSCSPPIQHNTNNPQHSFAESGTNFENIYQHLLKQEKISEVLNAKKSSTTLPSSAAAASYFHSKSFKNSRCTAESEQNFYNQLQTNLHNNSLIAEDEQQFGNLSSSSLRCTSTEPLLSPIKNFEKDEQHSNDSVAPISQQHYFDSVPASVPSQFM